MTKRPNARAAAASADASRRIAVALSLGLAAAATALAIGIGHAWAHSGEDEPGLPHFAFGEPGHFDDVDRSIDIEAGDVYFKPDSVDVKSGETIRFVVTNTGQVVHEFTIGTHDMQLEHQGEMMNMMDAGHFDPMFMGPTMEHADWNAVMVNPGERRVIIWHFGAPGTLEFGCNVPGHYESGMEGAIHVLP